MALPDWTEAGLLPPGAHAAKLPDVYDRFVVDTPNRQDRELAFAALDVHLRLIQRLIPAGKIWIDGSFATRRQRPPEDVDMAIHPADWKSFQDLPDLGKAKLYGLLTLQDVCGTAPPFDMPRLQPFGGMIDAFLCYPNSEDYWHNLWSVVKDDTGAVMAGQLKGYAEVEW
jgi:hypothetical protein